MEFIANYNIGLIIAILPLLVLLYKELSSKNSKKDKVIYFAYTLTSIAGVLIQTYTQGNDFDFLKGSPEPPIIIAEGLPYNTPYSKDYKIKLTVINNSNYPIRDVKIKFSDRYSYLNQNKRLYGPYDVSLEKKIDLLSEINVSKDLGTLPGRSNQLFYEAYVPKGLIYKNSPKIHNPNYTIEITSENGKFEIDFELIKYTFDSRTTIIMNKIQMWDYINNRKLIAKKYYQDMRYSFTMSSKDSLKYVIDK